MRDTSANRSITWRPNLWSLGPFCSRCQIGWSCPFFSFLSSVYPCCRDESLGILSHADDVSANCATSHFNYYFLLFDGYRCSRYAIILTLLLDELLLSEAGQFSLKFAPVGGDNAGIWLPVFLSLAQRAPTVLTVFKLVVIMSTTVVN